MENTPLLPEDVTRTSLKRVHLSMCVITCLHYVSSVIGSLVVSEYTFQYVSATLQGDRNSKHVTSNHARSNENCSTHQNEAQHESAQWNAYFVYAEYGPGVFVIVFGGILSDYLGRKIFILLPVLGTFLQYLSSLVVVQYNLDVKYIFIGCVLSGFSGTHYTLHLALCGSVADVSSYDKSRTFSLALLHLYAGVGSAVAQMSTGYMIKYLGYSMPCLVSVALCFLNFLAALYIPETLPKSIRKPTSDTFVHKLSQFFAFYTSSSNLREGKVWQFVLCLVSLTLIITPLTTRQSMDIMYFLGQPFCFTSEEIGWFNSANSLAVLCLSVILLKIFHLFLGDEVITILSCVSGIACFTIEGFASVWWMLYVAAGCGVISLNPLPVIKGIMSRLVNENRQGALFANVYFLEAVCRLAGSSVFFNIYADTQYLMRGFVYLVYAGFFAVGAILMIPLLFSTRRDLRKSKEISVQV